MTYDQNKREIYCYHCMEVLEEDDLVCPYCGHKTGERKENARALPPGTVLEDKYLIGEVIGEGGFGITYIGMDLNLRLKVAVKEYFPAPFASRSIVTGTDYSIHVIRGEAGVFYQKGIQDYEKEANRLAQFASLPGIVSVLNFFYANNTAYMVMDFVEGITLKEYLSQNDEKLPWEEVLKLLRPVIVSLKEIHKAGIIHRDISPDNIMVSTNGEMVLIDFGAARKVGADQKKTVVLKKGYAPLEQYQTDGNQGPWSDVYSFCATIYRMIGGIKAPDALAIAGGSEQRAPLKTLAKDIPDFLDKAIKKGMENEISARIQSMEELEGYLYRGKRVKRNLDSRKVMISAFIATAIFLLALTAGNMLKKRVSEKKQEEEKTALFNAEDTESDKTNRKAEKKGRSENTAKRAAEEKDRESADTTRKEEGREIDAAYEELADTQGLTYENVEGGLAITGVDYSATEVVIPGEIDGQKIKELRSMSPNAISVVIKNGVERITSGAFRNCVYLESLYIPASVTVIEEGAFENCMLLSSITVSEDNENFYSEEGKLYSKEGTLIFG